MSYLKVQEVFVPSTVVQGKSFTLILLGCKFCCYEYIFVNKSTNIKYYKIRWRSLFEICLGRQKYQDRPWRKHIGWTKQLLRLAETINENRTCIADNMLSTLCRYYNFRICVFECWRGLTFIGFRNLLKTTSSYKVRKDTLFIFIFFCRDQLPNNHFFA